jgi:DNA-binding GntR family transcriptional regulator
MLPIRLNLDKRRLEHERILQACIDHDPDRASVELHNHLARTANMIAGQMGGRSDELFELLPGDAESEKAAVG